MVIQQCQISIVCHQLLLQTRDLINLPNPQLASHDKGLTGAHKRAPAAKHFHFDARHIHLFHPAHVRFAA